MSKPFTIPESGFAIAEDLKPVSIESERALIGCVLRGGRETFEIARAIVKAEMLWSSSHQEVWKALEKVYEAGLQIDVIILGDEMERMQALGQLEQEWGNGVWSGRAYLADLRSNGDPRNVETYAEQVQDYHFKRFLLEFSGKTAGWSANGRRAKDIISDIYTELGKLDIYTIEDEHTASIVQGVSEAYDWTDNAAQGKILGVPTGLMDLDKILGTLINGNVYIVAGRPGMGKTGLLLSIARNTAKTGKRIGIFSLEMSRLQVSQRLIAQEAELDLMSIIQGTLQDREWAKFTSGVETVASYPISINDLSSININQIRQTARKIKAKSGLDLLIMDYIQLAGSENNKGYERRELEVSAVSRGLKHLANELNIPILAAAQLSRAVEQRASKRPILSDLRESGSLEQDAYAVTFIYKPEDASKQNIICLDVAKHRNGPVGECELLLRSPFVRFDNLYDRKFVPATPAAHNQNVKVRQ